MGVLNLNSSNLSMRHLHSRIPEFPNSLLKIPTDSYRFLPIPTDSYRFLPIPADSYRFLPIPTIPTNISTGIPTFSTIPSVKHLRSWTAAGDDPATRSRSVSSWVAKLVAYCM
jgi:hypothetical protein